MSARISRRAVMTGAAAAMLGSGFAAAQVPAPAAAAAGLPKGPITLVVPFAAGGATDVVSRLVAQRLTARTGLTVVVENIGGAGGSIGAAKVAKAPADGHMLLMGTVATHAIHPLSTTPAPYNPQRDFAPISLIATVPNVLLVGKTSKAQSVQELVALLKAQPGQFSYGSSGVGTPPHLSGELFKSAVGAEMAHVPYKGGAPAMADLVGGHIPVLFDVLTGAASHIRAGSARALAVTTATRSPSFPDVPTMAEAGVPGYDTYTWNAVFGPAGLPAPMVQALSRELQAVVAEPEVQARLKDISANPVGSSPEALATLVQSENEKWGPVIRSIGGLQTK
jgi:tripartite-type tricarboxylate transporter receptor subunit TctC